MRTRALFAVLALAACGREDGANLSSDRIADLASGNKAAPAAVALRPRPLGIEDLEREEMMGAGCSFSVGGREGQMVFAADTIEAIARIGGRIVRFTTSGPLDPAGSFFESGEYNVSIGRIAGAETPIEEGVIVPARMTLTDRRTEARYVADGEWTCGA